MGKPVGNLTHGSGYSQWRVRHRSRWSTGTLQVLVMSTHMSIHLVFFCNIANLFIYGTSTYNIQCIYLMLLPPLPSLVQQSPLLPCCPTALLSYCSAVTVTALMLRQWWMPSIFVSR